MLQTFHPVGQGWRHETHTRSTGATLGTSRKNRSIRMLYRRHFRSGEKGGSKVGKTKRGKGTKLMVITDAHGLPLAVHTASASPHEVTLVEATLDEAVTVGRPRRLIGDRAYDGCDFHLMFSS
ncbi:transposase [Noviherbaspirillum malthae]|uniref:transposase n=1 Tax=Noviherbaspirillum malthae TaxID=1260987 RepID=UPI0034DD9EA9